MRGEAGVWHAMEYKLDVAVKFSEDDMDKLVHTHVKQEKIVKIKK